MSSLRKNEMISCGLVGSRASAEFQEAYHRRTVRVADVVAWRRRSDHAEHHLAAQSGSPGIACVVGCPGRGFAGRSGLPIRRGRLPILVLVLMVPFLPLVPICPMRFGICSKASSAAAVGPGYSGSKPGDDLVRPAGQ